MPSNKDTRPEVSLPEQQVYVDPSIDPSKLSAVEAYKAGLAARVAARRGSLPKQDMPLGGGSPKVHIPLLTGHPTGDNKTMADYAQPVRQSAPLPQQSHGPSIIQEGPPQAVVREASPIPRSLGLLPNDILTGDAQKDPAFRQGAGSHLATSQPGLAAKYGVIRDGVFVPPQKLNGAKRQLSPETIQGLQEIAKMQAGGKSESDEEARKAVEAGVGGAAARAANVSGDNDVDAVDEEQANDALKAAIRSMDAFEFNEWRQLTMKEMLNSPKQQEIIESRLAPLELDELILRGFIRQVVPIVPGKYEIELQSHDGDMNQALKRLIMTEAKSVEVTAQYYVDKYSYMSVALGLHRVNTRVFPSILDENGNFDDKLFYEKFNMVMKLPVHMLASIGVQLFWFEMRVRKLFRAEVVGNG